jgi:hypothetical protein
MQPSELDPRVAEALPLLLPSVADEVARRAVEAILGAPGVRLIAADGADYLFALRSTVREEHPHYRFFVFGRLLEIHGIAGFSNEYSMADFPDDLAACRSQIESRFARLITKTESGLGWFERAQWEDLTPEQQATAGPKFIQDNVRYFSL